MGARRVSVLKTEVSLLVEVLKVHFKICTNPTEIVGGYGVVFQNDFHFGVAAEGSKLRPAIPLGSATFGKVLLDDMLIVL